METLESSRVCRLCGKQSGISINIFDKNENHVKKINAVLPIMVHEMDLLPKHMCHRCSYKLEEFHKFYVDCLKTDADLKSQLSWMRKEDPGERAGVPMVHIENIKIKVEPPDFDAYDMNAMVDNVDYVNSMNSVPFPVNGIRSKDISKGLTYAAYARCGCYCDKADQSNQTVSANFNNRIPRCSRVDDVETGHTSCLGKSQAVRTNFLSNKALQEPTSLVTFVDKATFNLSPSRKKFANANDQSPRPTIVRNLRPRKSSGNNCVGTRRKKSAVALPKNENKSKNAPRQEVWTASTKLDTTEIKVEKIDEIAGRILRPRMRTIDYIGPKRKYSRSIGKNQRTQDDEYRLNTTVVSNISNKFKLPLLQTPKSAEDRINLTIKKEQVSDLGDSMRDESVLVPSVDLIDRIDTLSNDRVADVQNDPMNSGTFRERSTNRKRSIVNKWKSLNTSKSELQPRKIGSQRTAAINHSSKYLRSQDVHLRNGKIRKFDSANASAIKLRRSVRNLTEMGKTRSRAFLTAIGKTVKKLPVSSNAFDNIKHYCEECNTSFANKELFKLHPCYGH